MQPPIRVGLVEIGQTFANARYFPYSTGLLQAYAQKHAADPGRFAFLEPVFRRTTVAEACRQLARADIVGFSAYVWNTRFSLAIARGLKEARPDVVTVFGGPNVPHPSGPFLREHPWVDLVCHGEGEATFLNILEALDTRDWPGVKSISFVRDGELVQTERAERIEDLSALPSPYLDSVFDGLLAKYTDRQWDGLWETNRGCPYRCAYCDWGSRTKDKVLDFGMDRLDAEIEWFARHRVAFIFCCDANFGIRERDVEIAERVAKAKERWGFPEAFSVQNAKQAVDRCYQLQRRLSAAGLQRGVTLAMQSMNEETLEHVRRTNIPTDTFQELQRRFNQDGIATYTDLILGLPAETYDSFVDGASELIHDGQHNRIQFINLAILPNAEMAAADYQREHGFVCVETDIVNHHGTIHHWEAPDRRERQTLVVATSAMPAEDWVRARVFSWWTSLLHFDKLMQIPLILLHESCGPSYRELVEAFMDAPAERCPTLGRVNAFFKAEAQKIQQGGPEYYPSSHWLNVYWHQDEFIFMELLAERDATASRDYGLTPFYEEARGVLVELLERKGRTAPAFLDDAMQVSAALIKWPGQTSDATVDVTFNVWAAYQSVLCGQEAKLEAGGFRCHIDRTSETWSDWQDWALKVVWRGSKKGAYLYDVKSVERMA